MTAEMADKLALWILLFCQLYGICNATRFTNNFITQFYHLFNFCFLHLVTLNGTFTFCALFKDKLLILNIKLYVAS